MAARVGAVTVNYNAGEHLIDCVRSLRSEGVDEIVVVDNGSTDGSLALLADSYPDVPVVQLPNPGFGAANNRGVRDLTADVLLLLNPDAALQPGALAEMQNALDSDSRIAAVGPRIENDDGSLYPSARRFPSFVDGAGHALLGLFSPGNRWTRRYKNLDWDYSTRREVDWVSGSAMLVRRAAFESVRGFDEAYWMFMEDVDLCWRLRRAGWQVLFEPAATVTHVQGVSTGRHPYRYITAHHRSLVRYHLRTARGAGRLLAPLVVAGLVLRLPVACAHHYLGKFRNRTAGGGGGDPDALRSTGVGPRAGSRSDQ